MAVLPANAVVGEPTKASDQNTIIAAIGEIDGILASLETTGILNSNFEIDTAGEPDNWTFNESGGGSHVLNTSTEMSGEQSITLTTTAASGAIVDMESDKVNGGNLLVDLSFMYRTTATRSKFRVEIIEYNNAGTPITTHSIATYAANVNTTIAPMGINITTLIGNSTQFSVKFILGDTGETTAGSVDIDSIIIKSRADFIDGDQTTPVVPFNIFIPAGINTIAVDIINPDAPTNRFVTIGGINGTNVASGTGTSTVTVTPLSLPGIFAVSTTGSASVDMPTVEGFRTGIVYA